MPRHTLLNGLSIAAALLAPAPASAQEESTAPQSEGILPIPDYSGDLTSRAHLLGDWNGARSDLAARGLQLDIDLTQHLQSVLSGGRDTATRYGGSLDALLMLDLQRMDVLPGAVVTLRTESRFADSINDRARLLMPVNTDMFFPLTTPTDDSLPLAITELTYTQYLSTTFAVFGGKLNTLGGDSNEFASGRGKTQFGNADFVFNPVTALAVPYSTLGGGALWAPTQHFTLVASIFNAADSSTTSGFEDVGDGWTVSTEAQFKYNLGDLPGGQNLGFIYAADGDWADLDGIYPRRGEGLVIPSSDDTWSLYWSAWQYVWADPSDETPINAGNGIPDRRGVGLFARAGIGDDDTLPIDWHLSGGLGGRGLIPSRPDDHFGLGYYYSSVQAGFLSGFDAVEDETQGFEGFYSIALTPAAALTMSIQAADDAVAARDTAIILGARLLLRF